MAGLVSKITRTSIFTSVIDSFKVSIICVYSVHELLSCSFSVARPVIQAVGRGSQTLRLVNVYI